MNARWSSTSPLASQRICPLRIMCFGIALTLQITLPCLQQIQQQPVEDRRILATSLEAPGGALFRSDFWAVLRGKEFAPAACNPPDIEPQTAAIPVASSSGSSVKQRM